MSPYRFTVEFRLPREGEMYFGTKGDEFVIAIADCDLIDKCPVIVQVYPLPTGEAP